MDERNCCKICGSYEESFSYTPSGAVLPITSWLMWRARTTVRPLSVISTFSCQMNLRMWQEPRDIEEPHNEFAPEETDNLFNILTWKHQNGINPKNKKGGSSSNEPFIFKWIWVSGVRQSKKTHRPSKNLFDVLAQKNGAPEKADRKSPQTAGGKVGPSFEPLDSETKLLRPG